MTNVALWTRISDDHQTDNQLQVLREWSERRGWTVVHEFVCTGSAWEGRQQPMLTEALREARLGKFQILACWALDRLERRGPEATLSLMRQFREQGCQVISLQEPFTDGPAETQALLVSIMAWVAGAESSRRSERVKAGLARRKAEGKPIGRAPGAKDRRPRKRSGYVARYER
jgi:DNA invertase Pin-like site-specific DNA recombinase